MLPITIIPKSSQNSWLENKVQYIYGAWPTQIQITHKVKHTIAPKRGTAFCNDFSIP